MDGRYTLTKKLASKICPHTKKILLLRCLYFYRSVWKELNQLFSQAIYCNCAEHVISRVCLARRALYVLIRLRRTVVRLVVSNRWPHALCAISLLNLWETRNYLFGFITDFCAVGQFFEFFLDKTHGICPIRIMDRAFSPWYIHIFIPGALPQAGMDSGRCPRKKSTGSPPQADSSSPF